MRSVRRISFMALVALSLSTIVTPAGAHPPVVGVVPSAVSTSAAPGATINVAKTVHTPVIPPTPDIVLLADTTGSMGPAIADVQTDLADIVGDVSLVQPNAQFAAAQYKDFDCPVDAFAFNLDQAMTADTTAVQTAVNSWTAPPGSGCDIPEAQINALFELATNPAVGFRANSTRIVAWFGDAEGHDPSGGHTLADAIAALQTAGISVVAVDVITPELTSLDATGQATAVTTATGGALLTAPTSDDVSAAILAGISAVSVTVSPSVGACDPNLTLSFTPGSQTVTSGDDATFNETIDVSLGAPQGTTLSCTVNWLIDGNQVLLPDGSPDPAFIETIEIAVLDVTAPVAECRPTTNPSGRNVPPAGDNPRSGQNPDGFYQLIATDNVDPDPDVFLVDLGSGQVFGPFASGVKIKYTQAPGATPSQRPIGGPNSAVGWHIIGQGDAAVFAVDDAGNVSNRVLCLVPPPPK
jgi:hypothetical protein